MPTSDRNALVFIGLLFAGAAALLFVPEWRNGEARAGASGAIGLPLWMLSALVITVAAIAAALIVRHHRRR